MMERVFDRFQELFTERCNRIALLNIREDSVRYDFFIALSEIYNLKSWEIQLESTFSKESFILRNNKSKRKENPLIDLVVDTDKLKMCAEFGLFRQNSNEEGSINVTEKTVKMLNDMIRLGIDSYYTKRKAYFICVADDKMLNKQLRSQIIDKFPSSYSITMDIVNHQKTTKTAKFDDRFIKKMEELNFIINAKLLPEKIIKATKITRETKILIWEITRTENN